ncbi:DUF5385 domain-containing protein [Mycoplasmoides pneumoniae]|uniref:DUF5385 domain-containing protein n=1 Tax=Mycoplasmoides pneumoniae TaxID=2104 RepID=UPI000A29FEF6|nr:DUF5385 domain-containing protein [Mycoplasmoides pneumoniae]ARQ35410.1 hypothetical protein BIX63_03155 [Mycoplasmoides pneumoniae]
MNGGGQQGGFFGLLVIIIPVILLIVFFSKKKNSQKTEFGGEGGSRASKKDEVWKTVKQFLQEQNERGKEIIKTFVAKNPNPLHSRKDRQFFNQEVQAYITAHNLSKTAAKRYRHEQLKLKQRELYCIYFITKDAKTSVFDEARIIEAEVYQKPNKTGKGAPERLIRILGLKNFNDEMKWIQPLMDREEKRKEKEEKRKRELAARQLKRQEKKKQKTFK